MRTLLICLFLVGSLANFLQAQSYSQAAGVRFGYPWALSYKFFPNAGSTGIEVFAGYRGSRVAFVLGRRGWRYFNTGALLQIHEDLDLDDLPGLSWYYGGGGSVYLYGYDDGFEGADDYARVGIGLHAVVGLDYAFEDAPINLSIDWMPTVRIGDGYLGTFGWDRGGLSVRYVFGD